MDEFGGAAAGAGGVIAPVDEGDPVPSRGRVEGDTRAGDTAADNQDVTTLLEPFPEPVSFGARNRHGGFVRCLPPALPPRHTTRALSKASQGTGRKGGEYESVGSPEEEGVTTPITVTVNGVTHRSEVEPRLLLVYYLREVLGLTGTHVGCDKIGRASCRERV